MRDWTSRSPRFAPMNLGTWTERGCGPSEAGRRRSPVESPRPLRLVVPKQPCPAPRVASALSRARKESMKGGWGRICSPDLRRSDSLNLVLQTGSYRENRFLSQAVGYIGPGDSCVKRRRLPVIFASLFLCVAFTITTRAVDPLFRPWRSPANGGVNVLYCYLLAHGVPCDYSNLLKEQAEEVGTGQHTVATLAHLAAKNGLPLQPISLTMNELLSCAQPVIVHMDGESPEAGAFLLILSITDKSMHYLNGPSVSIHRIGLDDFRRVWSGVALLPKTSRRQDVVFAMIGFSIGIILTLALLFTRSPRSS